MHHTVVEGQRALADPRRARTLIVLHDDGPVARELELLLALIEPHDITEVHRIRIDSNDPGSVLAALDLLQVQYTQSRPDFAVIACDRKRRGLPVRGMADPSVLAKVARLPVPIATLPGPHGGLIDALVWRAFADVDDLDQHIMTLLARELNRAELRRLEAIGRLFTRVDTEPPNGSPDDAV